MDRPSKTQQSAGTDTGSGQPGLSLGPTDAEVEAWAERVRLRRQAWLDGPTEDERNEWQRRERARRATRLEFEPEPRSGNGEPNRLDPYEERLRLQRRYVREARQATEGVGIFFATLPFRMLADFVSAGREWEEESMRPARRRSIPFNDEEL
jgi:hypothetical protein